jgi:hypothetical protein
LSHNNKVDKFLIIIGSEWAVFQHKTGLINSLAPIAVKILLCRGSAQKIATHSGKKLQKENIKTQLTMMITQN